MNRPSEQLSASQYLEKNEKVKLLAYRLWMSRRVSNISGNADSDYFQAERLLEASKNLKLLLLVSLSISTTAFILGHSPDDHYTNVMTAVLGLAELADEDDVSSAFVGDFCNPTLSNS